MCPRQLYLSVSCEVSCPFSERIEESVIPSIKAKFLSHLRGNKIEHHVPQLLSGDGDALESTALFHEPRSISEAFGWPAAGFVDSRLS